MKCSLKIIFGVLLGASSLVMATPTHGGKPPIEAIDACADKVQGDKVTFETRRGDTLEATCETIKEMLVAVPDNHEREKR